MVWTLKIICFMSLCQKKYVFMSKKRIMSLCQNMADKHKTLPYQKCLHVCDL